MPIRKLQTNFTGGEVISTIDGRIELPAVQNGASLMRQVKVLAQGGVRRRGGLQFCADILTAGPYQHHEYVFNSDQTYQIVFRHHAFDVYDGFTGVPVNLNIGGPWDTTMLGSLSVHSIGDFTYVAHPELPTQKIQRLSAVDFNCTPFSFARDMTGAAASIFQPYHRFARSEVTLTVSAQSGYSDGSGWVPGSVGQVVCSVPYFNSNHVGTVLEIGDGQMQIFEVSSPTVCRAAVISPYMRLRLLQNALTIVAGTTLVEVYNPYHDMPMGNNVMILNAQAFGLAHYDQINGLHTITFGLGSPSANWYYNYAPLGPVLSSATIGGGPDIRIWTSHFRTTDWKEQMYSTARGWPHCVGSFQERLIFGGGRSTPDRLCMSRTGAMDDFNPGTGEDSDAILIGVSGRRTPIVRQVVSSQHLQIFTSEGEYYVPRMDNSAAITPSNVSVLEQSPYGIRVGLPAIEFDGSTIFISKNAENLRQMVFGSNDDGYTVSNLAFIASHLMQTPIWLAVQMEDAKYAEATAFIVNANHQLTTFTMVRSEKVAAWSQWSTGNGFRTACAVDSRAFFIVSRTVAGVEKISLEKLNYDRLLDGSIMGSFLGVTTGPASQPIGKKWIWGGFNRYIGQPITLVADGRSDIGLHTPDGSGHVYIDNPANTIEGGFGFTPRLATLPPEMALPDGPTPGEMRRVVAARINFENTLSVLVNNSANKPSTVGRTKVLNSKAHGDLNIADQPINGWREVILLGWDDRGTVEISQFGNGPMTVKSINLDVEW